jgi:hypothetical protein
MRVCSLAAVPVLRPSAAAPLAAPPAPLRATFGRTAVLPNPASLAGDVAGLGRALCPPTDARFEKANEALK